MFPKELNREWWNTLSEPWRETIKRNVASEQCVYESKSRGPAPGKFEPESGIFEALLNLSILSVSNKEIKSNEPLNDLQHIKELELSYQYTIGNIKGVINLDALQNLRIYECAISDIEPVLMLPNLTYLDLGPTAIKDFSALSLLTNLRKLSISGTSIKTSKLIHGNHNLEYLQVGNIRDVSNLHGLKILKMVSVSKMPPVEDCPNLEELIIDLDYRKTSFNTSQITNFEKVKKLSYEDVRGLTLEWLTLNRFPELREVRFNKWGSIETIPDVFEQVSKVNLTVKGKDVREGEVNIELIKKKFPNAEIVDKELTIY